MATDRNSVIEITSDDGADMSQDRVQSKSTDAPLKKKKFAPLVSLKKLFAGSKKKKKTKEEVTGVGLKSTSCEMLETSQGGRHLAGKNVLSMSADSIFTSERLRDEDSVWSAEAPGANFKEKLALKLAGRRSDEGLTSSPPARTTTVDALIENSFQETTTSMDNSENLEGFFSDNWASDVQPHSKALSPTALDFDVVSKTKILNVSGAKHKIAIKPKRKPRTLNTSRSDNTPMKTPSKVPQTKEKVSTPDTTISPIKENVVMSQEQAESSNDEIEVDISGADQTSGDETELNQSLPQEEEPEVQEMSLDFSMSDKSGISSDDDSKDSPRNVVTQAKTEEKIVEKVEEKQTVVVLRKKDSEIQQERDSVRRQTVAVESSTAVTPFGERKVKRASLIMENRNWDDLGKPSAKVEEEPADDEGGSEFASVFAKFRKQASHKKVEIDKKAEALENKRGSALFKTEKSKQPAVKKVSNGGAVTTGSKTEAKEDNTTLSTHPKDKSIVRKPIVVEKESKMVDVKKKESIVLSKPQSLVKKSNEVEKEKTSTLVKQEKAQEEEMDSSLKRTSAEPVSKKLSGTIVAKSTSNEITLKRTSGEIVSKRLSGEVPKRASREFEPKRNSGESVLKSDAGAKETSPTQTPTKDLENKAIVVSKFGGVQARSTAVNDTKKLHPIAKKPSYLKPDSSSTSVSVKSTSTKEMINVHVSGSGKDLDSSVSSTVNNNVSVKSLATAHKRDSPRIANRLRSQTLPDSAASKPTSDSPSIKRTNSQDGGVNKENIPAASEETTAKNTSVLRSSVGTRPVPQRLSGVGKPSWIDMAQKRKDGWSDDKDKDLDGKKVSSEAELAEKRASVLDLMKRFQ